MNEDNGYIYWMGLAIQHYGESAFERIRRMDEQITELETVTGLSVDNIIDLLKKGYRLEEPSDIRRGYETHMKIIALEQENSELRQENKNLRRRVSRMLFGGKRK